MELRKKEKDIGMPMQHLKVNSWLLACLSTFKSHLLVLLIL